MRKYLDAAEDLRRMKIFLEHRKDVLEHNKRYDKGEVSFTMNLNAYSDMSIEEFRTQMNGLTPFKNFTKYETKNYIKKANGLENHFYFRRSPIIQAITMGFASVNLPKSIDWRGKGAVTAVKDQEHCGSCWSFSTTGALEGHNFIKTGKLIPLSEQNLVDCTDPNGHSKCRGHSRHDALDWIKDHGGIETEKAYPYKGVGGSCKFDRKQSAVSLQKYVDISEGDEIKLQEAIAKYGPVSIAVDASHKSFQFYSSGIYYEPKCDSEDLNHAVLAVGYGTDKNGRDFYIVKNSWGKQWGEDGYIRMARNRHNNCGVATSGIYPVL